MVYTEDHKLQLLGSLSDAEWDLLKQAGEGKRHWQKALDELQLIAVKQKTIQGKAILRQPFGKTVVKVNIYSAPTVTANVHTKLNVLRHLYLYSRVRNKEGNWYLLGEKDILDAWAASRDLMGWVKEENLILWPTAQCLEFSCWTRLLRPAGAIYPNEQSLLEAARGGTAEILCEEFDFPYSRAIVRFPILEKKSTLLDGRKITYYRVACIAHNMKLALDYQQKIEELISKRKKLATIEVVFVVDGTANTRHYAPKIAALIGEIYKEVDDARDKVFRGAPQLIKNDMLRHMGMRDLTPELRTAILVYRDQQSTRKINDMRYSTECNFWDFTNSKEAFWQNFDQIVFSQGTGDQASQRKAMRALLEGKFTASDSGVVNPVRSIKPSWTRGSPTPGGTARRCRTANDHGRELDCQKFYRGLEKFARGRKIFLLRRATRSY